VRIVVTGATGNVGTSLVPLLAADPRVETVVGVARRLPAELPPGTVWHALDVGRDDLGAAMRDADAVVHLAWAIQPSRDAQALWRTNVVGTARVARAAAEAGVGTLVHASSVGAYSPGPKDRAVDESWPTLGVPSSFYARHKSEAERCLDALERERPAMRVVRMRPALLFKAEAASGIRRLFAGPLLPDRLVRPSRLPVVPDIPGLRFQAMHTDDAASAYRLALLRDVRGAFNLTADPVLDPRTMGEALGARRVRIPAAVARAAIAASWRLRLQPTPPGWLDMALGVPLMDASRARRELGWAPARTSTAALRELLWGVAEGAGLHTPPLEPNGGWTRGGRNGWPDDSMASGWRSWRPTGSSRSS
jgi:UDP-glucose 4-epimerase